MAHVIEELRVRARARGARIVLPETSDDRVVAARAIIEEQGLAEVVWVERRPSATRASTRSPRWCTSAEPTKA